MPTAIAPQTKPSYPPPLQVEPRRSGGWFRRVVRRVKLALAGDDETLRVKNDTTIDWKIFHNYHLLGIIDAGEQRDFQLTKHGSLNVRPVGDEEAEYLMLPLTQRVHRVRIYRRYLDKTVEVYDLRAA
jgi:hypothetical protein